MTSYRFILRRVGIVFIALGIIDIGLMAYCIATNQSYSSSFNIFAVIAGILLMRGNLSVVSRGTSLCVFLLTAICAAIFLLVPLLIPAGLILAELKFHPFAAITNGLMTVLPIGVLFWTYVQLRSEPVIAALAADGRKIAPPYRSALLGLALVAVLGAVLHFILSGTTGARAIALAKSQLGPNYHYVVQSISIENERGRAAVAAYNDSDIHYVQVQWDH